MDRDLPLWPLSLRLHVWSMGSRGVCLYRPLIDHPTGANHDCLAQINLVPPRLWLKWHGRFRVVLGRRTG